MTIALNQPSVDQTKGKKQFKEALANPSLILLKKKASTVKKNTNYNANIHWKTAGQTISTKIYVTPGCFSLLKKPNGE